MRVYFTEATEHLAGPLIGRSSFFVEGRLKAKRYQDGELSVEAVDRPGRRAALVAATGPGDARMLETLLALDALKAAGAKEIVLFVSYAGLARQDKPEDGKGSPAFLAPALLRRAGAGRIVYLDVHSPATLLSVPRQSSVTALPALASALAGSSAGAVVVAPDRGSRERSAALARLLGGLPVAWMDKRRPAPDVAVVAHLAGAPVEGRPAILVDDMIDTGGTIAVAAKLLKAHGARRVTVAATHGIFSGNALRKLRSAVSDIVVTNSLPRRPSRQVRVADCSAVLAKAIGR
jgi:ribose-phosphate pyrophosphokinase